MKVSLFGITGVPFGKHNIKDPRLDQADKLVEASKKIYVQVELIEEKDAIDSDAIIAHVDSRSEPILKDWEFVETRLSRDPDEAELVLLNKLKDCLEKEDFAINAGLTEEETKNAAVYNLLTGRPVIVAQPSELEDFNSVLIRTVAEGGYISFLTVGGKENRAWLIKKGTNAWEAAGSIHSDLQKGFIRAEIISFADLIEAGGETQAKRAGKMRLEQKTYLMQDCDIVNFRFSK